MRNLIVNSLAIALAASWIGSAAFGQSGSGEAPKTSVAALEAAREAMKNAPSTGEKTAGQKRVSECGAEWRGRTDKTVAGAAAWRAFLHACVIEKGGNPKPRTVRAVAAPSAQ